MASAASRLMRLFSGFEDAHGTHGVPERDPDGLKWNIKRTARTLRDPVTEELWVKHLKGERALGVIPIRKDNTCFWGSIDYDVYDADLVALIARVEKSKLPLVPCRSKSGGLHLFLFLEKPEPAADVQSALRDAAASLGMAECEIFPKQTRILAERNDVGNWMVMPYFGGTFDGKLKLQHGLKRTGAEQALEEFVRFCEKKQTNVVEFNKLCLVRRLPTATNQKKQISGAPGRGDFSDGPPCLQHIVTSGMQKDGRKRVLFMMALYFKRQDSTTWKEMLDEANRKYFESPLSAEEVTGVIRSCDKKDYEYTCKAEPMRSFCDSALCKTRRFGVGRGGDVPSLSNMAKLDSDPPLWFVDVEGERLELTTEELQSFPKFHKACMARVNKVFKPLKQEVWFSILNVAMVDLEIIPAPPEVGDLGKFREYLEEFLTNRSRGQRREDLLTGRPWEDAEAGLHYFTMKGLQEFLLKEGYRDIPRNRLSSLIKALGGKHDFINYNNSRGCNVWLLPAAKVQPLLALPAPEPKEDDI